MIPLWIANCFLMKYSTRTQRQVRTYGSRPLRKSRVPERPQRGEAMVTCRCGRYCRQCRRQDNQTFVDGEGGGGRIDIQPVG